MSERTDRDYLSDMLEAVRRIKTYTEKISPGLFQEDHKTQDAVIRNLEVIGEAAKGLSATLRERHADVPWRSMASVRDRLIHRYFGVNLDIVWDIITVELASLDAQIGIILEEEFRDV